MSGSVRAEQRTVVRCSGLFGSTVIGVEQTYKVCGERRDDLPGLRQVLADRFEQVEVTMVGNVAFFVARHPIEARQRTD
ncbi:hypothetical protein CH256_17610 [Rhodococcus sp. 05-2254-6]|nr:hypothetical protein CH256_17610 [Rhodococcus sp. 05-2254-6]